MKTKFLGLLSLASILTLGLASVNEQSLTVVDAEGKSFTKVTSAPTDWSGTYLIVSEASKVAFKG